MSHQSIVNVTVSRQTKAVTQAGFGVMMALGVHKRFSELIKFYSELTEMISDGFATTDPEYIAANAALAQNPRPEKIAIGRRQADQVGIDCSFDVQDNTLYRITISSPTVAAVNFDLTSDGTATANEIAAGLQALIPGASGLAVTATDDADGTITIDSAVSGDIFTVALSSNLLQETLVATQSPEAAGSAIRLEDDSWYATVLTSRTQAEVESYALWVEANEKLFGTASSDVNIINTTDAADTTTIAATLKAASYDHTWLMYHDLPATFPDAAFFGKQLPTDPGSTTWAFKTLTTIANVKLTGTQSKNAHDKKCNTYELIGGVNITFEGWVSSGEFIDVIRGIDWTVARISERIFSRKVNLPKIPGTDPGIAIIEAEVRGQLFDGITAGLFTDDPAPIVTVPLQASRANADKISRTLNNVTFEATLAGAIHHTGVQGVVVA